MFKGSHLMRKLWSYLLLGRNQVEPDISGGKEGEKQRLGGQWSALSSGLVAGDSKFI